MKDIRFAKLVLFVNGFVPLTLLLWDVWRKRVGANPLEFVTRTTGMLTLVFLLLSLTISPLRRITGGDLLIKFRPVVGVFSVFYGSARLLAACALPRFFPFAGVPRGHLFAPSQRGRVCATRAGKRACGAWGGLRADAPPASAGCARTPSHPPSSPPTSPHPTCVLFWRSFPPGEGSFSR